MQWQRVNNIYLVRTERGPDGLAEGYPTIFAVNHGADLQWHWLYPNDYAKNSNSWHYCNLPGGLPLVPKFAMIGGMFVGGVQPGNPFFFHLEFVDPALGFGPDTGGNWNSQGSFYKSFDTRNQRGPFFSLVPAYNGQICLRWKISSDYNNAFGVNIWCHGVAD